MSASSRRKNSLPLRQSCLRRDAALSAPETGRKSIVQAEEEFLAQLKAEKKGGWACYLHTTKDVPDGMVSVDHKTGRIEHLFVSGNARGKGIGQKMLDFARKKLEEYEHPRLSVLDTNARAIALYRRMGWKFTGEKDMEFDPAEYPSVVKKCALLWMQYEG